MISSTFKRLSDRREGVNDSGVDAGFTLIELMVVLLILAILLAIAIPTFLGVTKSANDRAAQSNLNTALVNAKSLFQTNSQSYALGTTVASLSSSMATSLSSAEPALAFQAGAVTSGLTPSTISVSVASDGNGIIIAAQAKSTGNCWYIFDNSAAEAATAATPYANLNSGTGVNALTAGTAYGEAKNGTSVPTCNAAAPPAASTGTQPVAYSASAFPSL